MSIFFIVFSRKWQFNIFNNYLKGRAISNPITRHHQQTPQGVVPVYHQLRIGLNYNNDFIRLPLDTRAIIFYIVGTE